MQRTLTQAVDMHQFIRCQIARGIHCSTEHAEYHHCSTSRRGEEPSARFSSTSSTTTRTAWWSLCTLIFLISDKVHIYSGEGRKTGAQHVMNDIDQPTMLEYILAFVRARLCVLAPRLSQGTAGWPFCRQLRSVCSHSGPTCQWYAKRKCIDWLAIRVLGFAPSYYSSLHHSLQGALHYDAFLSMHFHHQRDFRRVWFNAQLIRAW